MVERRQIPVVCISALPHLARGAGASRVTAGIKIPHPCGRPDLSAGDDLAARLDVVHAALVTLCTAAEAVGGRGDASRSLVDGPGDS